MTPQILIVDDNAANRETLTELLDGNDYRLLEAADGPEALKLAAGSPPDVVLLDVMMPGMDGYEVCRRLRADPQLAGVPVIMITSLEDQASRLAGFEAGTDDFVSKPFNRAELRGRVRTITRLNRYRRLVEAQAQARHSEERFRDLFENANDLIQCVRVDGTFQYVNRAWRETLGYSETEVAGLALNDIIHPDSLAHGQALFQRLLAGEEVKRVEVVFRSKDGRKIIVEGNVDCHRVDGQPVSTRSIFRDVTERVQAEAAAREALATLNVTADAVFIFDPETLRFSYVNQGAVKQLGFSREELLALTPLDLKPQFTEEEFRKVIAPLLEGSRPMHSFTTTQRRKDGTTLPVDINLQYVANGGGQPRFVAIARDVTERERAQQMTLRTQRLESIGTLASGVAHDLNNALAPILMAVELLRMENPDASPQLIDAIEAGAKRGAGMVRQLLTFAKGVEGERLVIQPKHLLKEMEKIIQSSFPKNLQLKTDYGPNLDTVRGDSTQLHRVLLNLCVNARDAMPEGGTLTLEAENVTIDATYAASIPEARPGRFVVWRVRDTGTGIPPAIMERIFEPFFTTKASDKGTGLGLSTLSGIVRSHRGFVQVYSTEKQGTTFAVYLPGDGSPKDETERVLPGAAAVRGHGESILVVDDEPMVLEVTRTVLTALNYRVITASDGAEAIIKVAENRNELRLVITDLHMPTMDGLTFVPLLKRMLPEVGIIITTGRLEPEEQSRLALLGVSVFLDKPFTQAKLLGALKHSLGNRVRLKWWANLPVSRFPGLSRPWFRNG